MNVIFDTRNIYYLPQYLPIYRELLKRGHKADFVCYRSKDEQAQALPILSQFGLQANWFDDRDDALHYYRQKKADWVFFGSGANFLDELHKISQSVQLGHGIGPKPSYYRKSDAAMSVRFIEGVLRHQIIQKMYPDDTFVQVGYSKLDPLVQGTEPGLDYSALGLDESRKTILYAPTFNPSSLGKFPDDWPAHFTEFNILIKPHTFTYTREQYSGQRRKLKKWSGFANVHVAEPDEISLLPYMKHADILLSEASSTLFEFVALDRPVIVCDFYQLKWFYRGLFRYRFERRFNQDNVVYKDIGRHVSSYRELGRAVRDELAHPERFHDNRVQYSKDHVGPMDGMASVRIVDYLESHQRAGVNSD